jgi:hypothetical protein
MNRARRCETMSGGPAVLFGAAGSDPEGEGPGL